MSKSIGIVGAGVGGLHLALYLQKHGIQPTILTDRTPEQYANVRLLNTVAHHAVTVARENELGVNHWDNPDWIYHHHDHFFGFPEPLKFRGRFSRPSRAVDYRLYLPQLMEDFLGRGGQIEYGNIQDDDVRHWPRASTCWWSQQARVRSAACSPTGRSIRPSPSRSACCASASIAA